MGTERTDGTGSGYYGGQNRRKEQVTSEGMGTEFLYSSGRDRIGSRPVTAQEG